MTSTPEPGAHQDKSLQDPRRDAGFLPAFYPRANGKDAPPVDAPEPNDRIVCEFLAVYYDLNREYARLLQVRTGVAPQQGSATEREQLQAIEKVLIVRDSLEDRYAPFGVIAQPVVKDGFTVDVKVSVGNVDAAGKRRSDLYTITTYVPIPLPPGTDLETLPIKIEGPGINPA